MAVTLQQDKTPAVRFEKEMVEDRNATIDAGRLVTKDVDMAYIKQIGEKDETPKIVSEWLNQLYDQATGSNGNPPRIPMEWYERAKKLYENWQKGYETPLEGYPVREWAILTKSQVQNLHSMSTFTVEQIAGWTENSMAMYGMGGRELRDKAKIWLASGDSKAEQISALQVENETLKVQLKKMMGALEELRDEVRESKEDKPRRKQRDAE
jgi:hypothetical protein